MAGKTAILSVRILGDSKGGVASIKKVSSAVAGLQRAGATMRGLSAGIFGTSMRLSMMATMFGSLAAVSLSSVGSLLSLAASLSSVALAGIAVPGILMGMGAAAAVSMIAFKDAGQYIGDLAPQFKALQGSISPAFWEQAAGPIRNLAQGILPVLRAQLPPLAAAMGTVFGSMAKAAGSAVGLGQIGKILEYTTGGARAAAAGAGQFVAAILTLGTAGASYLPQLGSWFTDIGTRFNNFINAAAGDGRLHGWIQTGITGLQQLGSAVGSIVGIFFGLAKAATAAGGVGLAGFADGLARINEAVNGPIFQGALITVFQGANQAVSLLGPGLAAIGGAFVALAPTIAAILPLATGAFSAILQGVGAVLSHPAVAGGLMAAFQGINTGVTALSGVFVTLAPLIGAVLQIFGALAQGVLPVFAAIISAVAPVITTIVTAFASWASANPMLLGTLTAVVGAIGLIIPVVMQVVSFVGTLVGVWGTLTAAFSTAMGVISPVITLVSMLGMSWTSLLAPIGLAVAAIGLIGAALVTALATSEPFRAALVGIAQGLIGMVAPIVGMVLPVLIQVGTAFMSLASTVIAALVPLITTIAQIFGQVIALLSPLVAWLTGVFAPVFSFLGTAISAAFTYIGSVISAAVGFINSVLQVFLAVLQGNWSGAWSALGGVAAAAWNLIQTVVQGGITFVQTIVSSGLQMISSVFSAVWSGITAFLSGVMSAIGALFSAGFSACASIVSGALSSIVSFIQSGFSTAQSVVASALAAIGSFISSGFAAATSIVSSALASIVSFISSGFASAVSTVTSAMASFAAAVSAGIQRVIAFFTQMGSNIISTIQGVAGRMVSMGGQLIAGLVSGIKGAAGNVVGALGDVVGNAISAAKSKLGIHSPSRVFKGIGQFISIGLANGIAGKAGKAVSSTANLVRGIVGAGSGITLDAPTIRTPKVAAVAPSSNSAAGTGAAGTQKVEINFNNLVTDPRAVAEQIELVFKKRDILMGAPK